jgi:hypothetical protein
VRHDALLGPCELGPCDTPNVDTPGRMVIGVNGPRGRGDQKGPRSGCQVPGRELCRASADERHRFVIAGLVPARVVIESQFQIYS